MRRPVGGKVSQKVINQLARELVAKHPEQAELLARAFEEQERERLQKCVDTCTAAIRGRSSKSLLRPLQTDRLVERIVPQSVGSAVRAAGHGRRLVRGGSPLIALVPKVAHRATCSKTETIHT
jgi:hypothetical protein